VSAYSVEDRDSMSFRELVAWAWRETPAVHANSTNLSIHLFAVSLFVSGHLLLLAAVGFAGWLAVTGFLCIVVSLSPGLRPFPRTGEGPSVHRPSGLRASALAHRTFKPPFLLTATVSAACSAVNRPVFGENLPRSVAA
jgi:hypothetical protein